MKTNVFAKLAVVAMAAFGAFAFNGNAQPDDVFSYKPDESTCTNIRAECSQLEEGPICKIIMNGSLTSVYDLDCINFVRHDDSLPVNWSPINP